MSKDSETTTTSSSHTNQVSTECKIELDEEDYVNSFKTSLTAVVYEWCQGKNFAAIMELTDTYEGLSLTDSRLTCSFIRLVNSVAQKPSFIFDVN